jgi:hypothetical protein
MNRLVKIPSALKPYLSNFCNNFTEPSYISFCHLVTALAVCDKSKTIYNLHETMADNLKKKKGRSSYNWFITDSDWDEDELAQRKVDLFLSEIGVKKGNRILLIIDDTYNEKRGKKTEGVGRFFDHSKGFIWGNSIVTSVIQAKDLFIPHKAKIYVKKDEAGADFRTKIQIALYDIIKPLQIPQGTELMVVFDSWWYSSSLVKSCLDLGHNVTCQIKSDKNVILDNGEMFQVKKLAEKIEKNEYRKVAIKTRGKSKIYLIAERVVQLGKSTQVRLVISKENNSSEPKYYICTDSNLTAKKILSIYENRWDIETAHREANQKLGFKDYQLRGKKSIERFMQLVFIIWTGILLVELETPPDGSKRKRTLGEMVENIKYQSFLDMMIYVLNELNIPIPDEGGLVYKIRALGLKVGK